MGRKPPEYRTAALGGDGGGRGGGDGGGGGVGSLLCSLILLSLLLHFCFLILYPFLIQRVVSAERNMFFENHDHIGEIDNFSKFVS